MLWFLSWWSGFVLVSVQNAPPIWAKYYSETIEAYTSIYTVMHWWGPLLPNHPPMSWVLIWVRVTQLCWKVCLLRCCDNLDTQGCSGGKNGTALYCNECSHFPLQSLWHSKSIRIWMTIIQLEKFNVRYTSYVTESAFTLNHGMKWWNSCPHGIIGDWKSQLTLLAG